MNTGLGAHPSPWSLNLQQPDPTLIDDVGLGGVIALHGFDYQLADGMVRLCEWMANPAFEGMIFESMEDLEARFFAPQVPHGHLLERVQAKSGYLAPAEVLKVFRTFARFEAAYPQSVRLQTLVTPRLPASLAWLVRDPRRLRLARPFYAPFTRIVEANDKALMDKLTAEYEPELGGLIFQQVEVYERGVPDRAHMKTAFSAAFSATFSDRDFKLTELNAVFEALETVIRANAGVHLSAELLRTSVEEALGYPVYPRAAFPLQLRSDRLEAAEPRALELDGSSFSGSDGMFPPPAEWTTGLIEPLRRTASWLTGRGIGRITPSGVHRLTTAFVLGWSFRSALGFEIDASWKGAAWPTDVHPDRLSPGPEWVFREPAPGARCQRLHLAVGIIRNTEPAVGKQVRSDELLLAAHYPHAVTSPREVQTLLAELKRTVERVVSETGASQLSLYFAGPAFFAIAMGHRWNSMPSTQLHEYRTDSADYIPTAHVQG